MADIFSVIDGISGQVDRIAHHAAVDPAQRNRDGQTLAGLADEACRLAQRSATIARSVAQSLQLLNGGQFRFRTPEEARMLSSVVAGVFPDPKRVETGISELLLNAVEHGNLGISYDEKTRLLATGALDDEIARRLLLPKYSARQAMVEIGRDTSEIWLIVKDEGEGFDWQPYLEFSDERACDSHGRGIATARLMCFSRLEYRGKGNEVLAAVRLLTASPKGDAIGVSGQETGVNGR